MKELKKHYVRSGKSSGGTHSLVTCITVSSCTFCMLSFALHPDLSVGLYSDKECTKRIKYLFLPIYVSFFTGAYVFYWLLCMKTLMVVLEVVVMHHKYCDSL